MVKKKRTTRKKARKNAGAARKVTRRKRSKAAKATKVVRRKAKRAVAKKGVKGRVKKAAVVTDHSRAKRAYDAHGQKIMELLAPHGVKGIGYGPRIKEGKPRREMTISLEVPSQEIKDMLKKHADEFGLKRTYDGVGTDIVVWNFRTAAMQDGDCIAGVKHGTLGTTAVRQSDGTAIWLTAAHVVSNSAPVGSPAMISQCGGGPIGKAFGSDYVRNSFVDTAFVVPDSPLPNGTTPRIIRHLTDSDINKQVTMNGARTQGSGTIVRLNHQSTLVDTGEFIQDHIVVDGGATPFAVVGDSGAIVKLGSELIGMLRAVDDVAKKALVSNLEFVGGFDL